MMCDIPHMIEELIIIELLPSVFMPIAECCLIHYKMHVQIIRVCMDCVYHLIFGKRSIITR